MGCVPFFLSLRPLVEGAVVSEDRDRGSRWGGVGYRGRGSAAALADGAEPESGVSEEVVEEEAVEEAPPSMADRWRLTVQELGRPDTDRHALPGRGRRLLRRLTLGAYKGLEPEAAWRRRLAVTRALAPMPADVGVGTVVVAQPKGGIGKSPVSVMTACALGEFTRLSPVLWDCNENAGARWSVARFSRTAEYLLGEPERGGTVLSQVEATAIDQDHQAYQVIAAPTPPRNLADEEFEQVYGKLAQRFTQVVIDTGNTVTAANFTNAIRCADVVVVPTDLAAATLAPTLALFEVLERRWGREEWGRHVIGVETNPVEDPDPEWVEFFESTCAEVVRVPFDPHIASRGMVTWSGMSESTRRACLHLAGAVTDVYRNNSDGDDVDPTRGDEDGGE